MSARSPAEVFADAATVIQTGGGQPPRIVITLPDIYAAQRAAGLLVAFMGRQETDGEPDSARSAMSLGEEPLLAMSRKAITLAQENGQLTDTIRAFLSALDAESAYQHVALRGRVPIEDQRRRHDDVLDTRAKLERVLRDLTNAGRAIDA